MPSTSGRFDDAGKIPSHVRNDTPHRMLAIEVGKATQVPVPSISTEEHAEANAAEDPH